MARPTNQARIFSQFVELLTAAVSARLGVRSGGASAKAGNGRRRGGRRGALDMICRVPGCKNRSRGPRFGFICDDHRKKLSAKEQAEVRAKHNAGKKSK